MRHDRSQKLLARALQVTPGGVHSPVRAFQSVGGDPIFLARGEGPYVYDADGNRYIDYVCSYGPLILGHAPPAVVTAIAKAAQEGTSFGASHAREVELAEKITQVVPSVEKIRFVNSGTEATMSALRLARGFTKRDKLIKFAGCYHGHADAFLTEAGSGVATLGIPGSAGVPQATAADTLTVPYNDLAATEKLMQQYPDSIAAIIVEPLACNMGMVQPEPDFLAGLRNLCDQYGSLLIFDEVISGFRVQLSGAQGLYGVRPDLTTFGKIVGGGLPVGAYGGRRDIMDCVAPIGPVYQAGTLAGNPLAMAAGLATLEILSQKTFYAELESRGAAFEHGMNEILTKHHHPLKFLRVGSIFYLWFKAHATHGPRNYDAIKTADVQIFAKFFRALLSAGIMIAPSGFEVAFISAAHGHQHIDATLSVVDRVLASL